MEAKDNEREEVKRQTYVAQTRQKEGLFSEKPANPIYEPRSNFMTTQEQDRWREETKNMGGLVPEPTRFTEEMDLQDRKDAVYQK